MKKNLMKQIEQACRDKEIDYNDLIDLGIKLQGEYIREITKSINARTKKIDEYIEKESSAPNDYTVVSPADLIIRKSNWN